MDSQYLEEIFSNWLAQNTLNRRPMELHILFTQECNTGGAAKNVCQTGTQQMAEMAAP